MQSASGGYIFKNRMVPGHKPETGLSSARVRTPSLSALTNTLKYYDRVEYESKIATNQFLLHNIYLFHTAKERKARDDM